MNYVGQYKGLKVFRCSQQEYTFDYSNNYYWINDLLIKNNMVVGRVDREGVVMPIPPYKYILKKEEVVEEKREIDFLEEFFLSNINYNDYMGEVNKFFEELKK